MAGLNVEDVGMRLVLSGAANYLAKVNAIADAQERLNKAMEASVGAADAAASASDKQSAALTEQAKAAKGAAAATAAARDTTVAASEETGAATVTATTTQTAAMRAAVRAEKAAMAARLTGWKTLTRGAAKILKVGAGILAVGFYESIKNYNAFQQQITQSAIDAGMKQSQLPALASMAMSVSDATGLAATSVADMIYRLASANPKLNMTTKAMREMVQQAGNLYVLAGNTGNYDQIARTYGAIVSNQLSLRRGGKALQYNTAGGQAINEWVLATVGHGDIKVGDLVSALGTGLLPIAKAYGLSLNDVGALLDVLTPGMNARAASTRLKTAIGMIGSPSQKAVQASELIGGNFSTMAGLLRSKGPVALMNYLAGLGSKAMSGKDFIGGDIFGAASGKYKGLAGARDWLEAYGFTNPGLLNVLTTKGAAGLKGMSGAQLQQLGFVKGTSAKQAEQEVVYGIIGQMFGGGHTGAAIIQELIERKTLATKLAQIRASEQPTVYERQLRLAYGEPIVAFHKFEQQLKNFTIVVGRDVSPAFDAFLSDLEHLGKWFGANKWALKALGGAAGLLLAGSALIKLASGAASIIKGTRQIYQTVFHLPTTFKALTSPNSLNAAKFNGAVDLFANASEKLQLAASGLVGDDTKLAVGSAGLVADDAKLGIAGLGAFGLLSQLAKLGIGLYLGRQAGEWLNKYWLRTPAAHLLGLGTQAQESVWNQSKLDARLRRDVHNPAAWNRDVAEMRSFNLLDLELARKTGISALALNPMSVPVALQRAHEQYTAAHRRFPTSYGKYAVSTGSADYSQLLATSPRSATPSLGEVGAELSAAASRTDQAASRLEQAANRLSSAAGAVAGVNDTNVVGAKAVSYLRNKRARA